MGMNSSRKSSAKKALACFAVISTLLSGCSAPPVQPSSLTSLSWEDLANTQENKAWSASDNCSLSDLEAINDLDFLPLEGVDNSRPSPKDVMVSRTGRLVAAMKSEKTRLQILAEVSEWDAQYFKLGEPDYDERLEQIWRNPQIISQIVDNWVTGRSKQAIDSLSSAPFSSPIREKLVNAWELKCDDVSILREVRTTITNYEVAMKTLVSAVVADFEKLGYKPFFNSVLIKRNGLRTWQGKSVLSYSAIQFNYCQAGYMKDLAAFYFDAPALIADPDGIMPSDYTGQAEEATGRPDGPPLGTLRDYVFQFNVVGETYWKTNDFSGLSVSELSCTVAGFGY